MRTILEEFKPILILSSSEDKRGSRWEIGQTECFISIDNKSGEIRFLHEINNLYGLISGDKFLTGSFVILAIERENVQALKDKLKSNSGIQRYSEDHYGFSCPMISPYLIKTVYSLSQKGTVITSFT